MVCKLSAKENKTEFEQGLTKLRDEIGKLDFSNYVKAAKSYITKKKFSFGMMGELNYETDGVGGLSH